MKMLGLDAERHSQGSLDALGGFPSNLVPPAEAEEDDADHGHAAAEAECGDIAAVGRDEEGAGNRRTDESGEGHEEETDTGT